MTRDEFLDRLDGVRRTPSGWQARCPSHDDRRASLSISEGKKGIVLHCHAGCNVGAICDAMKIKVAELFHNGGTPRSTKPRMKIVATYDYQDDVGKLLFQCVRFEPKDFRQRRPNPAKPGTWIWNLTGLRRVLYRLPGVKAALAAGSSVFVVEGEKDADALANAGFVATCNPMGAGKWLPEHAEALRGAARVVVFADKDTPGRSHAQSVATSLCGVAKSVKLLELPDRDGQAVKDAAEWFAAGGKADELRAMVVSAPEFSPAQEPRSFKPGSVAGEYLRADGGKRQEPERQITEPPLKYSPPPLTLLPSVLRDYVLAIANSLGVDVAFIFLPLLSALTAAIGNSRSLRVKKGFVQPAILWTAIVARSGSKKSPALTAASKFLCDRERELVRRNVAAEAVFDEERQKWNAASKKARGKDPKPPPRLTCLLDDLTLAVIAPILRDNPRGALVAKDELASWLGSFGQFSQSKGGASADLSGWLSLFNGERLLLDRKTNRESHRIFHPRLSIAGCIPPSVLRGALTADFFQRGLPARIFFAAPPPRPNVWTDAEVPAHLEAEAAAIFTRLYALEADELDGSAVPVELSVEPASLEVFKEFYNRVAHLAIEAEEKEEAAWSKLTGGAVRLALVGHLAHGLDLAPVSALVMKAAVELASWFGHEAERIYAYFSEPPEAALRRRLVEFIERRGGSVRVAEVAENFRPLKNKTEEIEQKLTALVMARRGEWTPIATGEKGGRPTRRFHLLSESAACPRPINPPKPLGNDGFADADTSAEGPPANKELVEEFA